MVHLKNVSLRACSSCNGIPGKWSPICGGCGGWVLFAEGDGHRWILCHWSRFDGTTRPYVGRPAFADVHRDLTDIAASEHFTLPGEPDSLALQLLRETEPKPNVGRGFAA